MLKECRVQVAEVAPMHGTVADTRDSGQGVPVHRMPRGPSTRGAAAGEGLDLHKSEPRPTHRVHTCSCACPAPVATCCSGRLGSQEQRGTCVPSTLGVPRSHRACASSHQSVAKLAPRILRAPQHLGSYALHLCE